MHQHPKTTRVSSANDEQCVQPRPRRTGGKKMEKIWAWRAYCAEERAKLRGVEGNRAEYKEKACAGCACFALRNALAFASRERQQLDVGR